MAKTVLNLFKSSVFPAMSLCLGKRSLKMDQMELDSSICNLEAKFIRTPWCKLTSKNVGALFEVNKTECNDLEIS